jgi:hypothetical protein
MNCLPTYARIEPKAVEKLMAVEKDLGVLLLAYERPAKFATVTAKDLEKMESLEKEMGVKLVAFE